MASNTSNEGKIRQAIIEDDLVDCMVALPSQLFYNAPIPVCLWFLVRNKGYSKFRDRRKLGTMIDRVHRELTVKDINRITDTYHAWRGDQGLGNYQDIPGFCKSVTTEEIKEHDYVLTPGRYVGAEAIEDDGEPFEEKMKMLTSDLKEQFAVSARLEDEIRKNLEGLGYGF